MRGGGAIWIGAALALAYTAMIAVADGLTKAVAQDFAPPQLYAIAGLLVAALCLVMPPGTRAEGDPPPGARRAWLHLPRTAMPRLTALRAVLAVAATLGFFYAFRDLPLAELMVMIGTMPLMGAVLSGPILGERPGARSWAALGAGCLGVGLLFWGEARSVGWAHMVALGACVAGTLSMVLSRRITREDRGTLAQVFYPNFAVGAVMALALPFVWQPMPPLLIAQVLLYALMLFAARWTMVIALKRAPAYVVLPMLNMQFVWMAVIGFVFFGETPGVVVLIGTGIVIAAGLALVREEARAATPAAARSGVSLPRGPQLMRGLSGLRLAMRRAA